MLLLFNQSHEIIKHLEVAILCGCLQSLHHLRIPCVQLAIAAEPVVAEIARFGFVGRGECPRVARESFGCDILNLYSFDG